MPLQEYNAYVAEERGKAREAMSSFLRRVGLDRARSAIELVDHSAGQTIRKVLRRERANLIVVGTHGKRGDERFLLGSVAEDMFRQEDVGVLAVPSSADSVASPWP